MSEENPLDQMMREMKKLLKQIEDNADKILDQSLSFENEKKMAAWEKSVDALVDEINTTVKNTGIPPQLIQEVREEIPEALTSDERETLKRMKKLKEDIESLRSGFKEKLAALMPEEPVNEETPKSLPESTRKGSRKSKFKRMGGDDWKPV